MVPRILEIAEDGRHLSLYRGFVKIMDKHTELGKVPLSELSTVLISANRSTLSKTVLSALSKHGIATVICGKNYQPAAIMLPVAGNWESAGRASDQIEASEPLKKQIWALIVREKIRNQARVLSRIGNMQMAAKLLLMADHVLSGDKNNREAQAAKLYWTALFGTDFKRSNPEETTNAMLNYAYAIIRSAAARAICAAGMLPGFGVSHRSRVNSFALADDLMEPFRPVGDWFVHEARRNGLVQIEPATKRFLAKLLHYDVETEDGTSTLGESMHYLAYDMVKSFAHKKNMVSVPLITLSPINLA